MQKAVALCLCLLGASALVFAEEEAASKDGKVLSLFSVVSFPNDMCDGDKRNGTCYTSEECENRGGSSSGSCASGYGVCCVFELECGDSSSSNNTYIVQSSVTTLTSPCTYTICKCSSAVSRIRFDFTGHVLAGPNVGTATAVGTGATGAVGSTIGHCVQDQFSISSPGAGTPIICGSNTGQHMIVDADENCHMVNFNIGSSTGTSRSWDIWVTQYNVGEEDQSMAGPPGCLQYFTGDTGYVRSYNMPTGGTTITASIVHLANQEYTSCIRRNFAKCFICYTPIAAGGAAINQGTFGVSIGPTAGTVQGSVNSACLTDFIQIPGGAATPGTYATTVAEKFCGRYFASAASATAHATVCTRRLPFHIAVKFDETEITTATAASMTTLNEQNGAPSGIVGFGLSFVQGNC